MLTIDTKPYPPSVAIAITAASMGLGRAKSYAPGRGDYNATEPFEENDVTSSRARWAMTNAVFVANPRAITAGPSNAWVYRSLIATPKIVNRMKGIATPTLIFQVELDQIVKPKGENEGCAATPACRLVVMKGSQHEILMESDSIRDAAFSAILRFFH